MTFEEPVIRRVRWGDPDTEHCRYVRRVVFIVEQDVPEHEEWDDADASATHWIAVDSPSEPIGTARMTADGKIGRVAVLRSARGRGIGALLMRRAIEYANKIGLDSLSLDAQLHAIGFYEQLGFSAEGPEFLDAGILHRRMTRAVRR